MTTAYSYIRFSSKAQEDGHSLERQLDRARYWCSMNNVTLSDVTYEDLGRSAFSGKRRPALEELIECVESGAIPQGSFVLFEDADRVTRQGFLHGLELLRKLVNLGVNFVTLNNGQVFDASNVNNLSTALPFMFEAERAWRESTRKSELVRAAKKRIREANQITGNVPFWIDVIDDTPVLNQKADIVRSIVELKLQGLSNVRIARHLNSTSQLSPRGKAWSPTTVRSIFTNPAIYGAKQYYESSNGELKPLELVHNLFPAVCSAEDFRAMQPGKLDQPRTRVGVFNRLLRCGSCGGTLTRKTTRGYALYTCAAHKVGTCSDTSAYRLVDEILTYALRHLSYVKLTKPSTDTSAIITLQEKLDTLNQTKEMITNPVALSRIYEDIAATEQQLDELYKQQELTDSLKDEVDYASIFELPTDKEKNTQLRKVINSISLERLSKGRTKFVVNYKTNDKNVFIGSHAYRGNEFEVSFNSDTKRMRELVANLLNTTD